MLWKLELAFRVRVQFNYKNGNEKANGWRHVVAIFDNDFSISDSNSSKEEDIYTDMGDAAIDRRRLREETRRFTVEKNASGVMLQTLKTSKRTQK